MRMFALRELGLCAAVLTALSASSSASPAGMQVPLGAPQPPSSSEVRIEEHRPMQPHVTLNDITSEPVGWYDPRINGGRMLDFTTRKYGEPLNVIISAFSDPYILTEPGLHTYAKSIGFSEECLGLHYGNLHGADLGDGDGRKEEQFLARQNYFPGWGTCWESAIGGNHFRAWRQNGTEANSGAWFLGVSKELDSGKRHTIAPDGYNIGRDLLVANAVQGSRWRGMWWQAEVEWVPLLKPGKDGVNHGIEQDGMVAVLTVVRL